MCFFRSNQPSATIKTYYWKHLATSNPRSHKQLLGAFTTMVIWGLSCCWFSVSQYTGRGWKPSQLWAATKTNQNKIKQKSQQLGDQFCPGSAA